MKKNKMMRLASGLLVAVLLTTCAISGTFAKYVKEYSGEDQARVAKFSVNSTVANIDIFAQSAVFDSTDDYTQPAVETDVASKNTDVVIAPGTWGKFTFDVTDASEVTVKYLVDYTVDEAGVPLQWSADNGATWSDDLADVEKTLDNTTEAITVMWKWVYENNADAADTALGEAGAATPSVKIKVTFTQVD